MRPGGTVVVSGATGGPNPPAQLHRIFFRNLTVAVIEIPGAARADVIVGGCCVLVGVFRKLGFDECLVSEADILDGLIYSQL